MNLKSKTGPKGDKSVTLRVPILLVTILKLGKNPIQLKLVWGIKIEHENNCKLLGIESYWLLV